MPATVFNSHGNTIMNNSSENEFSLVGSVKRMYIGKINKMIVWVLNEVFLYLMHDI